MSGQDYEQLTLYPEDSLASRFPLPGSEEARKMTVTSGRKCCGLLKSSGPLGLLARMLLESSIWRSTRCYLTWRTKATKQGRLLFRLAPSMPRTGGTGSPLWLGTMTASQTGGNHSIRSEERRKGRVPSPAEFVMMWPTPSACNASTDLTLRKSGDGRAKPNKLGWAVSMWTTPTAADSQGTSGGNNSRSLRTDVGGQLNPTWVEWLMGFPIGWTDLDASETP